MSKPEPVGFPLWNYADPTTHDVFNDALASMPRVGVIAMNSGRDMARGYAWGRIDSPGYVWPAHGGDGLDFMMAYAIHLATSKHNHAVREAFNQWHSTGRIG